MLNWFPALLLLLMHGAAAPDGVVRDARLPFGTAAFVQSAARHDPNGRALSATLRLIAQYAARVEQPLSAPVSCPDALSYPALTHPSDETLPCAAPKASDRTRDGPSIV